MARGEETGRHPNRQVSRKMKSFGYGDVSGGRGVTGDMDTRHQMSDNPNMVPVRVGSQKSKTGGYQSVVETGGDNWRPDVTEKVGYDTFRTRMGARRSAKKNVKQIFDPNVSHSPMEDELR